MAKVRGIPQHINTPTKSGASPYKTTKPSLPRDSVKGSGVAGRGIEGAMHSVTKPQGYKPIQTAKVGDYQNTTLSRTSINTKPKK
jgi:hypothetical protein